jgi:four helix bundle protein
MIGYPGSVIVWHNIDNLELIFCYLLFTIGDMTPQELSDRLWHFAARVGKLVDVLPESRLGRHVSGQLVRCGTAAAPNYDEGRAGESRADFAHKINVALKEIVETQGWLKLIAIAQLLPESRIQPLREECDQFGRILGKSVATARGKYRRKDETPITNPRSSIFNNTEL